MDPATLPHLELYLRSDTLSGANGGSVTRWSDSSGHSPARDANSSAGTFPTLSVGASPTGKNLVRYSTVAAGSQGINGTFPPAPGLPLTNGYSVYAWYQIDALTSPTGQKLFTIAAGAGLDILPLWGSEDPREPGNHVVVNQNNLHDAGLNTVGAHVLSIVAAPPSGAGTAIVRQDGSRLASWVWTWSDIESGYNTGNNGPQTRALVGTIGAILVYSVAHDDATRGGVEKYLRSHYG